MKEFLNECVFNHPVSVTWLAHGVTHRTHGTHIAGLRREEKRIG